MDASTAELGGILAEVIAEHTYLAVFLILWLGGFGLPVPEELTLLTAGFLVHQGVAEPAPTAVACLAGMLLGDSVPYLLGYGFGPSLASWRIVRWAFPVRRMVRIRRWFARWGGLAVFFGRLLTGVRHAVFVTAGMVRMSRPRFIVIDAVAASVSLTVWAGGGLLFGEQIRQLFLTLRRFQGFILLGVGAVVIVVLGERLLVRLRWIRRDARAAVLGRRVRITAIVVVLAFLVAVDAGVTRVRRQRLARAAAEAAAAQAADLDEALASLPALPDGGAGLAFVAGPGAGARAFGTLGCLRGVGAAPAGAPTWLGRRPDRSCPLPAAAPGGEPAALLLWGTALHVGARTVWVGRIAPTPAAVGGGRAAALAQLAARWRAAGLVVEPPRQTPSSAAAAEWTVLVLDEAPAPSDPAPTSRRPATPGAGSCIIPPSARPGPRPG